MLFRSRRQASFLDSDERKNQQIAREDWDSAGVIIQQTPNGWINDDMMVQYVNSRSDQCQGELLMLILDVSKAHWALKLKRAYAN
jgi:hypothetical protein